MKKKTFPRYAGSGDGTLLLTPRCEQPWYREPWRSCLIFFSELVAARPAMRCQGCGFVDTRRANEDGAVARR